MNDCEGLIFTAIKQLFTYQLKNAHVFENFEVSNFTFVFFILKKDPFLPFCQYFWKLLFITLRKIKWLDKKSEFNKNKNCNCIFSKKSCAICANNFINPSFKPFAYFEEAVGGHGLMQFLKCVGEAWKNYTLVCQ